MNTSCPMGDSIHFGCHIMHGISRVYLVNSLTAKAKVTHSHVDIKRSNDL